MVSVLLSAYKYGVIVIVSLPHYTKIPVFVLILQIHRLTGMDRLLLSFRV